MEPDWDLILELIDEDLGRKISPEIDSYRRFEDCIYHGEQIMAPFSHLAPPPQTVRPPMAPVSHLVPPPQTVRPSMAPVNQLPPPPPTVSCVPVAMQPEVMGQNPVGVMYSNGQLLFKMEPGEEPDTFFTNPPPNSSKRKRRTGNNDDRPYIKKPPNAFMLFMKEQRPNVKAKFLNKDSATVNKALGQMWKSLTPPEQEKYFQEAEVLNQIHSNMYPQWSCRDNYGKKKRRKWRNPSGCVSEVGEQSRSTRVTMVHTMMLQSVNDVAITQEAADMDLAFSMQTTPQDAVVAAAVSPLEQWTQTYVSQSATQLLSLENVPTDFYNSCVNNNYCGYC
ncbi:transcription factor 7-like 1-B [Entelurus aequoreus]|uniref:transcription factor 7-like 1-B n=1 Tax=Entelurus aequoreus TaxID=161455 RepID=UPI002B1E3D62|nr:transcription factor 7-like 1-B [Entelurus aequoreus]